MIIKEPLGLENQLDKRATRKRNPPHKASHITEKTIVHSEPMFQENHETKRATVKRNPRDKASHIRKQTIL